MGGSHPPFHFVNVGVSEVLYLDEGNAGRESTARENTRSQVDSDES